MIAFKVFTLLGLALLAHGSDLDKGLNIMKCAQRAISVGVPELGIPSHEPYVVIKHNFSWNGDINLASVHANITDLTWAGLARWNLSAVQVSKDTDDNAVFDFELYWDWLEIDGKFSMDEKELILHQHQEGNFSVEWNKTAWIGRIDVTKPTEKSNGTVNHVKIDWHVIDLNVKVEGFGALDGAVEATLGASFKNALNHNLIRNTVGDFIKMRLEKIWWNTGKVWELVNWCDSNNSTMV